MTTAVLRNTGQRLSWVHLACGAFIVLWLSVGVGWSLAVSVPSIAKIGVLGLWVLLAAARPGPFFVAMINAWPLSVMLVTSVLIAPKLAGAGQDTQGFGYLLIAFALYSFYSQPQYRRERNMLLGFMAVDFAMTGVRTFVALQADPVLSRFLATTEEKRVAVYGDRSFAGLGGYGYAYSLVAILLVLLYFTVRSERGRLLPAIFFIGGLVILFKLAFTTAIILVGVIGLLLIVRLIRPGFRLLIYAAAILGWISGLYSAALNGLSGQSWVSAAVSDRLRELSGFLAGQSADGTDLGTRISRWKYSIDIFLENGPLGLAGRAAPDQVAGGHSQWFDLLASYGILALLPVLFLILAWRLCVSRAPTTEVDALRSPWIYLLLLGFVNPSLFSTIVLTWMFFLPSLVSWLDGRLRSKSGGKPGGIVLQLDGRPTPVSVEV